MLPRWAPPPAAAIVAPAAAPNVTETLSSTASLPAAAETGDDKTSVAARRLAQELLRATLTKLEQLNKAQAESWGRAEMHRLAAAIALGEKAYREQRFRAAQDAYREALAQAARLAARLPEVIKALIEQGDLALANGRSAQAATAYIQVLAIVPDHPAATKGRTRAANLDRVRALVEQAEAYEAMGAEDKARATFGAALQLDGQTTSASAGLARLDRAAHARRFQLALSEGHAALARDDYNGARQAFQRAAALQPQAAEISVALKETESRATAAAISAHLREAKRAKQGEAWSEAARHYAAALALDAQLSTTADDQREADQRARLDTLLESLRNKPADLIEPTARDAATRALATAQALPSAGPHLQAQVAALTTALRQAREPVTVRLHSNGFTRVSIAGVGDLGSFALHPLALMPGRYSALGRRDGYRDVRIEFEVAPAASALAITVQCDP